MPFSLAVWCRRCILVIPGFPPPVVCIKNNLVMIPDNDTTPICRELVMDGIAIVVEDGNLFLEFK
jgi:hypothetical protein